jgi:hypothetical protein
MSIFFEFMEIHNSALGPAVELNECVEQAYLPVKAMIRRIKIIVKKTEIKRINNERIATIQMKKIELQ